MPDVVTQVETTPIRAFRLFELWWYPDEPEGLRVVLAPWVFASSKPHYRDRWLKADVMPSSRNRHGIYAWRWTPTGRDRRSLTYDAYPSPTSYDENWAVAESVTAFAIALITCYGTVVEHDDGAVRAELARVERLAVPGFTITGSPFVAFRIGHTRPLARILRSIVVSSANDTLLTPSDVASQLQARYGVPVRILRPRPRRDEPPWRRESAARGLFQVPHY